ncbi:hypothetical protein GCM10027614_03420 [Micromonospora vulcania]
MAIGVPLATRRAPADTGNGSELVEGARPGASSPPGSSPAATAHGSISWSVYRDTTGFSVPAPRDWRILRHGRQIEFLEPGGERALTVSQTDSPRGDPLAELTARAKDPAVVGQLRDYRRIEVVAVNYQLKAADWEWVHTSQTGTAMHTRQRTFDREAQGLQHRLVDARCRLDGLGGRLPGGHRGFPAGLDGGGTTTTTTSPSADPTTGSGPGSVALTPSARPRTAGDRLVGVASKRCLDISAPDSPDPVRLQLWDCQDDRDRNQLWTLRADGSVQLGGRCLDVLGASSDDRAAIQITTCNTTPAQQFTLNGQRQLVNAHSGKCVGPVDLGTGNGTSIEQRTCTSADAQEWTRG